MHHALSYAQLKANLSARNRSISMGWNEGRSRRSLGRVLTSRVLDLAVIERFGNHGPEEGLQGSQSSTPRCWPDEDA